MPRVPHASRGRNDGPQRRPKPRPSGYATSQPSGFAMRSGNGPDRPRPQPPRRASGPAGPARVDPIEPVSGKSRRRMAKAAAWRLAKILHVRPADVAACQDLEAMLERVPTGRGKSGGRGQAARLAAKVVRLRRP